MQFNINEMFGNLGSSPSKRDVSSESEEEFSVEPGNVQALDERFRVRGPSTDAMSAFVSAATATLFPSPSFPHQSEDVINTSGSQIERQLMNLVEVHQTHEPVSSPSFIDTECKKSPASPDDQDMDNNFSINNYGRPSAAI